MAPPKAAGRGCSSATSSRDAKHPPGSQTGGSKDAPASADSRPWSVPSLRSGQALRGSCFARAPYTEVPVAGGWTFIRSASAAGRRPTQDEVAEEQPPPTALGGAKRAAYWNTGFVWIVFLVACIHRLQAKLFQSFQEAFRSLQSSFKRLPNISPFFQKISIDFPESGLINGLRASGRKKSMRARLAGVQRRRRLVGRSFRLRFGSS